MSPQYRKGRKAPWIAQVRNVHGKIVTASFATKESAEEFEKLEQEKRRRLRHGLSTPREEILFIDYSKIWIQKRMQRLAYSSVSADERRLRLYWIPKLGGRPIEYITTSEILEELDRIRFEMGHTPAERNRHRSLLHTLFQNAILENRLDFNPVSRIPVENEDTEERRMNSPRLKLSDEELEIYLRFLYKEGHQYWILGNLLVWTGARICSANVIQYQDIDFDKGIVWIRRVEERASGLIKLRQKGGRKKHLHEHKVPLFPVLRLAILEHRKMSPYIGPKDFVATTSTGSHITYDTFRDAHQRVIQTGVIPPIKIHDLRRTFATNCKKSGYTRTEIKELLDHSTEQLGDLYDLDDIDHLIDKGKKIGFGGEVMSLKKGKETA